MLVSVIVPLYNYAFYIRDCLQSIINQTYKKFEIIVVDDCSVDSGGQIVNELSKQYSCINLYNTPINMGYSAAKNVGIIKSKGDLITCLDADDMFTKNSLEVRVNAFRTNTIDLVHALAIDINESCSLDQAYKIDPKTATRKALYTLHAQTVMMSRKIHIQFGLYDETLRSASDKEMWYRLFGWDLKGPSLVTKLKINSDVAYYRQHQNSMSAKRRKNRHQNRLINSMVYKRYWLRRIKGIVSENTTFLEN